MTSTANIFSVTSLMTFSARMLFKATIACEMELTAVPTARGWFSFRERRFLLGLFDVPAVHRVHCTVGAGFGLPFNHG